MALSGGGALSGAASGAAAGTAILPGWGTAIGGVVGGVAGLFSGAGAPQYDPYSTALQAQSYDLFKQGQGIAYPAEAQLIQYATDPTQGAQSAERAIGNVDQSFQAQQSARQRLFAKLGITPTEAQAQALQTQGALGKAQAEAGAANLARQGTIANQSAILR